MSILRKGGNGNPKNLVVAVDNGGIYSSFTSKSTQTSPSESVSDILVAVPEPEPPSALYTKSGYLEIPSFEAPKVLNLTLYTSDFCLIVVALETCSCSFRLL